METVKKISIATIPLCDSIFWFTTCPFHFTTFFLFKNFINLFLFKYMLLGSDLKGERSLLP